MKAIAATLFGIFLRLGGFGLLALGILDSSFLMMPLGNDLLVIAMTARRHRSMPYYASMATLGSVLGCLLIDWISRKGGEASLEKHIPRRRLNYIKNKVSRSAGWALAFASLMPPPFPFTPFVVAAGALQYPRKRMLAVIAATRAVRFFTEGALAIAFGRRILRWAESPVLQGAVIALIVLSITGSVISVYGWVRRSRTPVPASK